MTHEDPRLVYQRNQLEKVRREYARWARAEQQKSSMFLWTSSLIALGVFVTCMSALDSSNKRERAKQLEIESSAEENCSGVNTELATAVIEAESH